MSRKFVPLYDNSKKNLKNNRITFTKDEKIVLRLKFRLRENQTAFANRETERDCQLGYKDPQDIFALENNGSHRIQI